MLNKSSTIQREHEAGLASAAGPIPEVGWAYETNSE